MKKIMAFILLFTMVCSVGIGASAEVSVIIDNSPVVFDAKPVIVDDRVLLPIRAVAEGLGYNVLWSEANRVVSVEQTDAKEIKMLFFTIGSTEGTAYTISQETVDGKNEKKEEKFTLDAPAQIIENRTYLPIRFVAEYLNCKVDWDEKSRVVSITSKEHPLGALYFKNTNGDKRRVLIGGMDVMKGITIEDGRVFYLSPYGDLFSQKTDGTEKKCYSNNDVTQFKLYDGKLYYIDAGSLYVTDIDGAGKKMLAETALDFIINKTGILYRIRTSQEGVELGIVSHDGTPVGKPVRTEALSSFRGDTIYYNKTYLDGLSLKNALVAEKLDGSEPKTIATAKKETLSFLEDAIYFVGYDGATYRTSYDGANKEILVSEAMLYQGENEKHVLFSAENRLYRMDKNTKEIALVGEADFIACSLKGDEIYCILMDKAVSMNLLTGEIKPLDENVLQIVSGADGGVYYTVIPN